MLLEKCMLVNNKNLFWYALGYLYALKFVRSLEQYLLWGFGKARCETMTFVFVLCCWIPDNPEKLWLGKINAAMYEHTYLREKFRILSGENSVSSTTNFSLQLYLQNEAKKDITRPPNPQQVTVSSSPLYHPSPPTPQTRLHLKTHSPPSD